MAALRTDADGGSPEDELQVLTLASECIHVIDSRGLATSQCWSPDGNQIVYSSYDSVRVFDLKTGKIRILAKGSDATWSSDGNWVAFRDDDVYYAIRSSGDDGKHCSAKSTPSRRYGGHSIRKSEHT
jgi:WD40 repeat protein